jgi:hypothetical protein
MERLLILGDSFAADWTRKYDGVGWPNMLAERYQVTNLAQAGCSEYKIWLQLESIMTGLDQFDFILISHTSPYRIYIKEHPVHHLDKLHGASDLIYNDIKDKLELYPDLSTITCWFEKYFDLDYAKFVHNLVCEKIDRTLAPIGHKVLHITNLDWTDLYRFDEMMSFDFLFDTNKGSMNHYDQQGNELIFRAINDYVETQLSAQGR